VLALKLTKVFGGALKYGFGQYRRRRYFSRECRHDSSRRRRWSDLMPWTFRFGTDRLQGYSRFLWRECTGDVFELHSVAGPTRCDAPSDRRFRNLPKDPRSSQVPI